MKPLLFLVLVALPAMASKPETPILIDVPGNGSDVWVLNNKRFTPAMVLEWLADASGRFGRADPVVLRVQSSDALREAVEFSQKVFASHDRVFIELVLTGQPAVLVPVARDPSGFSKTHASIPASLPQAVPPTGPPAWRDPAAEQWRNFQRIERGEIPK